MSKLEVLNQGRADGLDILNEAVMDDLLGGTISCKKKYTLQNNGVINCGCGYTNDGFKPKDPDTTIGDNNGKTPGQNQGNYQIGG